MSDEKPDYEEYENYGVEDNKPEEESASDPAIRKIIGTVTGKIKSFFGWNKSELIILCVLSAFALLFTLIYYSVKFTAFYCMDVQRGELSFWSAEILCSGKSVYDSWYISNFNVYFIIAFIAAIVLYAAAVLFMLFKKSNRLFMIAAGYNAVLSLVCMVLGSVFGILRDGVATCCIISILFSAVLMTYVLIRRKIKNAPAATDETEEAVEKEEISPLPPVRRRLCRLAMLVCSGISLAILFTVFFVPLYSENEFTTTNYTLLDSMVNASAPVLISVCFIAMFIAFFAEILSFTTVVSDYFRSDKSFAGSSRKYMTSVTVITLSFFIVGFCTSFVSNLLREEGSTVYASTVSYIPFVMAVAVLIVYSIFCGRLRIPAEVREVGKSYRAEPLLFVAVMTVVTFVSLAVNILEIHAEVAGHALDDVTINGYQLLSSYGELEAGFQLLAFLEFTVLLCSGLLLMFSVIGFLAKDKNYYKLIKTAAVANILFMLFIGLFGIYFKIGQKVNIENIVSLLAYYDIDVTDSYIYEVNSRTIYLLFADVVIIVSMLLRGIFSLGIEHYAESGEMHENTAPQEEKENSLPQTFAPAPQIPAEEFVADFDACPAFTELDGRQPEFDTQLSARRKHLFANPTLPNLVRFVVDYARECRLHLSYSPEDIATFVAGLGASRLAILQGMSGTGKTSLPKVFTEALMGNCEIVEVESSWRDKNELLGYYNEFSKCFTPKKFTQCLYKARLNPSVLTFIVLDEMNLSRIEYYFSDFLSLMENEEDKREIKLLNVKLFRTVKGAKIAYSGLTDGHTIKIPANVWFIGTANRDESTFEISDKVYDRAQTMNFNKRAPKIHSFGTPLDQRFVPYDMLVKLFNSAISGYEFEAEDNAAVQKTEKLLAPYNISFGNRILKQMEYFVKIYCTCFGDKAAVEQDAVEKILLSKVVSKLENKVVENKELLAKEFDRIGLKNCGAFIRKLNED